MDVCMYGWMDGGGETQGIPVVQVWGPFTGVTLERHWRKIISATPTRHVVTLSSSLSLQPPASSLQPQPG